MCLEPVLRNKRSHCNEKPVHCNKEQPPLAETRESPRTATKTQHSQKIKTNKFIKKKKGFQDQSSILNYQITPFLNWLTPVDSLYWTHLLFWLVLSAGSGNLQKRIGTFTTYLNGLKDMNSLLCLLNTCLPN